MDIREIMKMREDETSALHRELGLFWAFSQKQFEENKTPLKEGEKYARIGGGGLLPAGNVERLKAGWDEIDKRFDARIEENDLVDKLISYELGNHECWYTGDPTEVLDMFGEKYGEDRVLRVFMMGDGN